MHRNKIVFLSGCSFFLLFIMAWFSMGTTYARYLSRFSEELSFSAASLPAFSVGEQLVSSSSYVLKPSSDSWSVSGGEKIYSFDLSLEGTERDGTFRIRVFVEDSEIFFGLQLALTIQDQRYNGSQGNYVGETSPFYAQYQTVGRYYCFADEDEEVACLLNSENASQTVTVSFWNTENIPPIWVCIDRIA